MPPASRRLEALPNTVSSSSFDPDQFFDAWDETCLPRDNDLRGAITRAFKLPEQDDYVYHAMASVNLAQVQKAISYGGKGGLHAWYVDDQGTEVCQLLRLRDS